MTELEKAYRDFDRAKYWFFVSLAFYAISLAVNLYIWFVR